MSLSRRKFVYVTSLSVVAATSAASALFAQDGAKAVSDAFTDEGVATLATLSLQDFEGLIGARFSISLSGRSLGKLTLVAASKYPDKSAQMSPLAGHVAESVPSRPIEGFLLRFQGAGGTLPQDTYLMEESSLGAFPLFIVPEGPGRSNRPTYLAIFARLAGSVQNTPINSTE